MPYLAQRAVARRRRSWPGKDELAFRPQASWPHAEDRIVEPGADQGATHRGGAGDFRAIRAGLVLVNSGGGEAMLQRIDHVNIVVADLPRMTVFYSQLLGLEITREVTIGGEWVESVVGLPDVAADVVYLSPPAGGTRLELIRYRSPKGHRPAGLQSPNTRGLRHLAFAVEDIEATVGALERSGIRTLGPIRVVPDSQVTYEGGARKHLVYLRDPEGNLLELCSYR